VNSIDDLVVLVRDQLGLPVTADDITRDFDQLPGWDSVYLLHLATLLEQTTGRAMSLPTLLDARNLAAVYQVAVPR
jgi:acyl carrier protein